MQASFEARFQTYFLLLSDENNKCNFLTVLFNRIVHFIKEREWVNDRIILEKFQASIQEPTDKTKEICQIFQTKIGNHAILDSIAEKLEGSVHSASQMAITDSRFSSRLWLYVSNSQVYWEKFNEIFTQAGKKLNDKDKSSFLDILQDCQASDWLEYGKRQLTSLATRKIKLDPEDSRELTEEEKARNAECEIESLKAMNAFIDQGKESIHYENVKRIVNTDNELNYEEKSYILDFISTCKSTGSSENRKKLLACMLEIEKVERNVFRNGLIRCLNRIIQGKPDGQSQNLRNIHAFITSHEGTLDEWGTKNSCNHVYTPLMDVLFPGKFKPNYRSFDTNDFILKNNRIYMPKRIRQGIVDPNHWVGGLVRYHKKHYTAYIYDGKHYIWLDQFRSPKKLTPQELYKVIRENENVNIDYFLIPENQEPKAFPNASKWMLPTWEENNCYIAATLAVSALVQFYNTINEPFING